MKACRQNNIHPIKKHWIEWQWISYLKLLKLEKSSTIFVKCWKKRTIDTSISRENNFQEWRTLLNKEKVKYIVAGSPSLLTVYRKFFKQKVNNKRRNLGGLGRETEQQ